MKIPNAFSPNITGYCSISLALLVCSTARLSAQDLVAPPPPPGMTNVVTWDGASWQVQMVPEDDGGGGSGRFHTDDLSGPPSPIDYSGGGTNGYSGSSYQLVDPGTNLWLLITPVTLSNTVIITFSNTITGLPYILEVSTNLSGPWFTNQSFLATNTVCVAPEPIPIESLDGVFFRGVQAKPGTVRWAVQLTDTNTGIADALGSGLDAAPSLSPDGQTVYMTTPGRTISAIDAMSGIVLWTDSIFTTNASSPQDAEFTGSAVCTSSNIYVGSCDGNLYCLNATNGSTNWIRSMGDFAAVYSTPALDSSGRIYVPIDETQTGRDGDPITGVMCLNPDGSTNWFFQPQDLHDDPADALMYNQGDVDSSIAVANDGTIYFTGEGWRLYSLDPAGNLNWAFPLQGDSEPDSSVAIDSQGRIRVGSNSPFLYCVNPDGSLEWLFDVASLGDNGPIVCSPTIGYGDAAYFGCGYFGLRTKIETVGNFYSLNADGGTNWVLDPDFKFGVMASPAIGSGAVYFGCADGNLYALTNGAIDWSFTTSNAIISSPLIMNDGSVVFGSDDGWLYCLWGSSLPATNAPWPMFHQNAQRTGLQPGTNSAAESCGAPFVFGGTNDGMGNFTFGIIGSTNAAWNVFASEDLSNWTLFATNVTLAVPGDHSTTLATNTFTDNTVSGVTQRFYQLSSSNCCSRAIGFTTLTIAPGTNLVANQLCQVDDGVMRPIVSIGLAMNTLEALLDLNTTWGTDQTGTEFYKWNGAGFDGDTNFNNGTGSDFWFGGGDMVLVPGSPVFLVNVSSSPFTVLLAGLVRNQQVLSVQPGTNFLSATAPIAGIITGITGYAPRNGETIKLWNTNSQAYDSHSYSSGSWSGGVPSLTVGEGFLLITTNSYKFTNNWVTSACAGP